MKWLFFFIVLLHLIIHILGFLKAFQLAEINLLTKEISKPMGILWLIALLILAAAPVQFIFKNNLWWVTVFVGIILSQILLVMYWQDAKFGTIPNIIIFLVAVVSLANWNFNRQATNEITEMFNKKNSWRAKNLN